MNRQANSSSSTILMILILIITFPFWILVGGLAIGLVVGIIGVFVGIIGALFGVAVTLVTLPFKILFGWGHGGWDWHGFPHFHWNGCVVLAVIIIAAMVYRSRNKA